MAKKFAEHNGLNLVNTNKEVLEEWKNKDIFHKSIDEREGAPQFIFFEGPPSANGHPGIHHVLARAIKDTFNRYKTMQGFRCIARLAGTHTDCLWNSAWRKNWALRRKTSTTKIRKNTFRLRNTTKNVVKT